MRVNVANNNGINQSEVKVQGDEKSKASQRNKKFQKKDGVLVALNKQLIIVKKQLSKLEADFNMPAEQKKAIKKGLIKQKGELDSQIAERQLQLIKMKEEEQKKKAEEKEEKKAQERIKIEDEQKLKPNFLKVNNSLSKLKNEHSVSKEFKSRAKILEGEIKLDEGRGVDVKDKREKLAKMKDNINKLSEKMNERMSDINKEMKKNVKHRINGENSKDENKEKKPEGKPEEKQKNVRVEFYS